MKADTSLMQAGLLDRKITIEQLAPDEDDGMRVKPGGWSKLCDRKAALVPLSGAEKMAAGGVSAFLTHKFRIRRPRSFTLDAKQNRLRYGQPKASAQGSEDTRPIWNITAIIEVDRDEIDLIATAASDQ